MHYKNSLSTNSFYPKNPVIIKYLIKIYPFFSLSILKIYINVSEKNNNCTFISFFKTFFGCIGSLLLHRGFLQLPQARATLHCGTQASHCSGFACCRAWALGAWASVVVARGLSSCGSRPQFCSIACGIFPDKGSNPCPLHWQADS